MNVSHAHAVNPSPPKIRVQLRMSTLHFGKHGWLSSVWLCTARHARSLLIAGLIKGGYNQGLIVYWSPLWDSGVLNNAIPPGFGAAAGPIHPACECSLRLLLSGDLVWYGESRAYLLRQTAAIQLSPPNWPALPSLTCFPFFFFINKVVR